MGEMAPAVVHTRVRSRGGGPSGPTVTGALGGSSRGRLGSCWGTVSQGRLWVSVLTSESAASAHHAGEEAEVQRS